MYLCLLLAFYSPAFRKHFKIQEKLTLKFCSTHFGARDIYLGAPPSHAFFGACLGISVNRETEREGEKERLSGGESESTEEAAQQQK